MSSGATAEEDNKSSNVLWSSDSTHRVRIRDVILVLLEPICCHSACVDPRANCVDCDELFGQGSSERARQVLQSQASAAAFCTNVLAHDRSGYEGKEALAHAAYEEHWPTFRAVV